jgi:hypothetical protein
MEKTLDYSIFKQRYDNRPLHIPHVESLKESLRQKNMLVVNPIIVNEDFEVIDGQHRLQAAKELGLEVYYIIIRNYSPKDIQLLNTTRGWLLYDYFDFYCKNQYPQYLALKSFIEKHNLTLSVALKITRGKNQKNYNMFKNGKYVFNDTKSENLLNLINESIDIVEPLVERKSFLKNRSLWTAMIQVFSHPEFDEEKWMHNLRKNASLFQQKANQLEYLYLILHIYNWRNQNKINFKGGGFEY